MQCSKWLHPYTRKHSYSVGVGDPFETLFNKSKIMIISEQPLVNCEDAWVTNDDSWHYPIHTQFVNEQPVP